MESRSAKSAATNLGALCLERANRTFESQRPNRGAIRREKKKTLMGLFLF